MSLKTINHIQDPKTKLAQFREHLDKQIILLTDKYQLPDIIGVGKQVPWAVDIRIKLLEIYDKRQSSLSGEESKRVFSQIFSHTEGRWWIDHKDFNFDQLLNEIFPSKQITTMKDASDQIPLIIDNYLIVIDTQDDNCLKVQSTNIDKLPLLMENYGFSNSGVENEWIKNISFDDKERVGIVEALSLSLLQGGFTLKISARQPPKLIHDGTLTMIEGKLCMVARTEPVYKAASRLGSRIVWIDDRLIDKLKILIKNYDIECTPDTIICLGDKI